jgi:hypothetical protein
MKRANLLLIALLCFAACKKDAVSPSANDAAVKANWSSSAQWATWQNGGYTLYNNIWGAGAGPQVIWANTYSNWGVWANHPNTGGIKSYPNSERVVNRQLSTLNSLTSSFNVTRPGSGTYISAYDVWDTNFDYEIMIWMNKTGGAKPISYNYDANGNAIPVFSNVSLGGHTWNIFRGNNTANDVFSFVRTSNTNSGTVDIRALLNWARNQGWMGNITVGKVQFGFEITSSSGGMDFICNSYSVSYN